MEVNGFYFLVMLRPNQWKREKKCDKPEINVWQTGKKHCFKVMSKLNRTR